MIVSEEKSMIQIDIEMPKDCDECPLCHRAFDGNETRLSCYGLGAWCLGDEGRLDNCPLHEVTDTDTISKRQAIDALFEILDRPKHADFLYADEIHRALSNLPPSPSRQHGHWIDKGITGDWAYCIDGHGNCWHEYECSECNHIQKQKSNFCPNCGADMRPLTDGR